MSILDNLAFCLPTRQKLKQEHVDKIQSIEDDEKTGKYLAILKGTSKLANLHKVEMLGNIWLNTSNEDYIEYIKTANKKELSYIHIAYLSGYIEALANTIELIDAEELTLKYVCGAGRKRKHKEIKSEIEDLKRPFFEWISDQYENGSNRPHYALVKEGLKRPEFKKLRELTEVQDGKAYPTVSIKKQLLPQAWAIRKRYSTT